MSSTMDVPNVARGETLGVTALTDGLPFEGLEKWFPDLNHSATGPVKPKRSNRMVLCRLVRNVSTIALAGKRLVTLSHETGTAGPLGLARVSGYGTVEFAANTASPQKTYALDEFLPTAGLPVNDLGWVVVQGPAIVSTGSAADAGNSIAVGDRIHVATAAASTSTTAGRARKEATLAQVTSGNTDITFVAGAIRNSLGRALSALTTANSNSDLLVDIGADRI